MSSSTQQLSAHPTKRTMHQRIHFNWSVLTHPQCLMYVQTDKKDSCKADLLSKARSCATLADKNDASRTSLSTPLLRLTNIVPGTTLPNPLPSRVVFMKSFG